MPFISFSYLIALARISRTMSNRSSESGYPYLVPDLSTLRPWLSCWPWICHYHLHYAEACSLRFLQCERLYFVKCIFCLNWDDQWFLCHSINMVYQIYWFVYIELSFNSRDTSRLWHMILLTCINSYIQSAIILLRIFVPYSLGILLQCPNLVLILG